MSSPARESVSELSSDFSVKLPSPKYSPPQKGSSDYDRPVSPPTPTIEDRTTAAIPVGKATDTLDAAMVTSTLATILSSSTTLDAAMVTSARASVLSTSATLDTGANLNEVPKIIAQRGVKRNDPDECTSVAHSHYFHCEALNGEISKKQRISSTQQNHLSASDSTKPRNFKEQSISFQPELAVKPIPFKQWTHSTFQQSKVINIHPIRLFPSTSRESSQLSPDTTREPSQFSPDTIQQSDQLLPDTTRASGQLAPDTTRASSQLSRDTTRASSQVSPDTTQQSRQLPPDTTREPSQFSPDTIQQSDQLLRDTTRASGQLAPDTTRASSQLSSDTTQQSSYLSPDTTRASSQLSPGTTRESSQLSPGIPRVSRQLSPDTTRASSQLSPGIPRVSRQLSPDTTRASSQLSPDTAQQSSQLTQGRKHQLDQLAPRSTQQSIECVPDRTQQSSQLFPGRTQQSSQFSSDRTAQPSQTILDRIPESGGFLPDTIHQSSQLIPDRTQQSSEFSSDRTQQSSRFIPESGKQSSQMSLNRVLNSYQFSTESMSESFQLSSDSTQQSSQLLPDRTQAGELSTDKTPQPDHTTPARTQQSSPLSKDRSQQSSQLFPDRVFQASQLSSVRTKLTSQLSTDRAPQPGQFLQDRTWQSNQPSPERSSQSRQLSPEMCSICGDQATGRNYGTLSCEPCKAFFRRTIIRNLVYTCHAQGTCVIDRLTRSRCQFCRFKKCLLLGMNQEDVQQGSSAPRGNKHPLFTHTAMTSAFRPRAFDMPIKDILNAELAIEPKTDTYVNTQKEAVTKICQAADKQLLTLVTWAKMIPHFMELSLEDQVVLLRTGWNELLIAGFCHRSTAVTDAILLSTGLHVDRAAAQKAGIGAIIDRVLTEVVCRMKALQMDKAELGCIRAILLLNPDVKGLQAPSVVETLRRNVYTSLEGYCLCRHPEQPARFAKVLLRLPGLRSVTLASMEHLRFYKMMSDIPVHVHIMDMLEDQQTDLF